MVTPRGRPTGSTDAARDAKASGAPFEKKKATKPAPPPKEVAEKRTYYCTSCGTGYSKLKGNFRASQSPFFKGWGHIPICHNCLNYFEEFYTENLGSSDEAIKRLALHLDLYFNDSLLSSSRKINVGQSRIASYIANANLAQYKGRSYDDYLAESAQQVIASIKELKEIPDCKVTQKSLKFWGAGYGAEDYAFLNDKYDNWTSRHECKTQAQESIFQNICLMELQIKRAVQKGDKIDALIRAFNDLLGSANVKPVQNKENALADQNTFGTLIQKWENERPIPEPDPEWEDVDGIRKYISVWFLGHLCRMMGINNRHSHLYDDEVAKYSVSRPEYEDDPELAFDDIFGGKLAGGAGDDGDGVG